MQASFPQRGLTWPLIAAATMAAAGAVVVFAVAEPSAIMWLLPWLVGLAGGVVASLCRPDLVAGRRLLLFGALSTTWMGSAVALVAGFEAEGRAWWLVPANFAVQVLGLAMWAAMFWLLAVYPDGVYRGRWLSVLARTLTVLAVSVPVALLIASPTVHGAWMFQWDPEGPGALRFPIIESPFHIPLLSFLRLPLRVYLDSALAAPPVVAAVVGALRYRSLPPESRLAMRWPMYGVVTVILAPLSMPLEELGAISPSLSSIMKIAGVSALPAFLAIGLVRPDLFDIDRVMRRSLVYAALWTAIALAYVAGAAGLGLAAPGEGGQLAIAATIGATLLFEPGRRALSRRLKRRLYGQSVTGEEMVRRLGGALADTQDIARLMGTVARLACEGMGVRWVRVIVEGEVPAIAGQYQDSDEVAASSPMEDGRAILGRIDCGPPAQPRRGRKQAVDQDLLSTLAAQTSLALRNARLSGELGRRLDEIRERSADLAASRARIVAAEETARRQLERDIHDGAQQEIVALIAGIGLARRQAGGNSDQLHATLDALQAEAGQALVTLRDLAAGIHPPVLSDYGLVEAIEMRSSKMLLAVSVECPPQLRSERFSDAVEGAAYFFVSEALTNTLKHARATKACVSIARSAQGLKVAVTDDGCGFDVATAARTGLHGLADRIEAIGGAVQVASSPGNGTRVSMSVPL